MGLEYRYNASAGGADMPANEYELDATYAATAKPNDVVKLNVAGKVVKAAAADAVILGVLVAKTLKRTTETPTFGKVITAKNAVFEVPATGAVVVGGKYELAANDTIDVAKTAAAVFTVQKLGTGTAYVSMI